MRSGKRGNSVIQDEEDQSWIPQKNDESVEDMDPNTEVEISDVSQLRRVSRSEGGNTKWGGVHMLRTGKRSEEAAETGSRQSWGWTLLRSLRSGRQSRFGGGHMMRSGKRGSWGPEDQRKDFQTME